MDHLGLPLAALLAPATATRQRRRLLMLAAMTGFAVANTVSAVSASCPVTMAARFVAGVASGLTWALLAGYARRLVPAPCRAEQGGRGGDDKDSRRPVAEGACADVPGRGAGPGGRCSRWSPW